MLYTIQYLVFGIQIVGPNFTIHIRYLVFKFSQYRLVFDIPYLVISKNQIIVGIRIW